MSKAIFITVIIPWGFVAAFLGIEAQLIGLGVQFGGILYAVINHLENK